LYKDYLHLEVSDEELEARRREWKACRTTDFTSGYRSRRWTVPMWQIISNREGRGHQCGLH
jgi:hypothetical protein